MGPLRVAVTGAGIGGLAAAAALTGRGIEVDVYEQAPALREVGAGLHLGSNGTRLLQRLGLAGQLRELAAQPAAMEVRNYKDGRVLARQPMGASWEAEFGAPYYTVHRADLHEMLASRVPPERLHLGRRLAGFAEYGEAIRLRFADRSTCDADVLVGADGIHSVVRATVAPGGDPVFSGNSAFRALVPASLPVHGPGARLAGAPVAG